MGPDGDPGRPECKGHVCPSPAGATAPPRISKRPIETPLDGMR
jgi:hypothetical protein